MCHTPAALRRQVSPQSGIVVLLKVVLIHGTSVTKLSAIDPSPGGGRYSSKHGETSGKVEIMEGSGRVVTEAGTHYLDEGLNVA